MNQVKKTIIKKNRLLTGFTLVELLVIIAVINLLASIILSNLNSVSGKARDAKRKSDLHQISIALELYYDAHGGYPSSAWPDGNYMIPFSIELEPKMEPFISTMPQDPRGLGTCYNNEYLYISNVYNDGSGNNARATDYVLYATLEDQNFNNLNPVSGSIDEWLTNGAGACGSDRPNYRVGNYNIP